MEFCCSAYVSLLAQSGPGHMPTACPQLVKADMRLLTRGSGFDPERSLQLRRNTGILPPSRT
jgi:hypothetical protein